MRTQFGTSFEKPKVERRAPIASESLDRVARKSELDLVPRCRPRGHALEESGAIYPGIYLGEWASTSVIHSMISEGRVREACDASE